MVLLKLCLVFVVIHWAKSAVPGLFFWKPRLGIDLSIPTTEPSKNVQLPTRENVQEGRLVLVDGYQAGMTFIALAAGLSDARPFPTLNPLRGYFYTNVYRWALRHFSIERMFVMTTHNIRVVYNVIWYGAAIFLSVQFRFKPEMESLKLCLIFIVIPVTKGGVPGTFYWKPRLGIDMSFQTPDPIKQALNKDNVRDGPVVLIDAFHFGMTFMGLAAGLDDTDAFPYLNPMRGYFYTNAYRWALRHFSLIPKWFGRNAGSYYNTHRVWKKRFAYSDAFLPKWLGLFVPPGIQKDWNKEKHEIKRFKKFAELSFIKYCKYPSKKFNNFKSQEVFSSENQESSSEFNSNSERD